MKLQRILIVEDDAQIGSILQRGLRLKGFETTLVEDGHTGRAAWATGAHDLILLDVMLPGIDGVSLCAERRAAGDTTPVILLTAAAKTRCGTVVWLLAPPITSPSPSTISSSSRGSGACFGSQTIRLAQPNGEEEVYAGHLAGLTRCGSKYGAPSIVGCPTRMH